MSTMKISFILSLLIILIFINYLIFFKKKHSLKINILIAFAVGIGLIAILVYPLLEYDNTYLNILASFMYALRCIGMGQDLKVLSKINLATTIGYFYFVLMNILFLIVPSLTVGFVISYLEKITTYIKFGLSKNKELYVFSEINEKSLLIAQNIEKKKKGSIIFSNVKDKTDLYLKAIKLNKKILNIKFNAKSKLTFYMIYNNEEQNLNETLELIHKYKNRENTKIYVFNKSEEAPVILDSIDKGKIIVEIINEKERAVFQLLNDKPLFLNAMHKTISILIVGCGNIGKEFLRDAVWCSMMVGYTLKILVVDVNANKIKENINAEMKELLDNYDITFLNEDIKSDKALEVVKARNDVNYILVATDSDDKNIDISILLRRLYIREYDREPIINLYIENELKQKEISSLVNEKGYSYNLNAFGSFQNLYSQNNIIDSKLERLAIQIHLSHDKEDKDLHRYNLREYNKRSSRASALHIQYKIYSILGDKFTEDMKENLKIFRNMYSSEIEELLTRNEHDRWMAYTRSIGYIYVSTQRVREYYEKNKHYIHYLAKMHPALVDFDQLDIVSKELSQITSQKIDFVESDKEIIRNIYETIDL